MKNHHSTFIPVILFWYFITFGSCNDPSKYKFKIEYVERIYRVMSPQKVYVTGPQLRLNEEYLERLCDAAKNHLLLDTNPDERLSKCLEPGRITYPDESANSFEHLHILWCNAIPQIWLRDTNDGDYVIMIENSIFVNDENLSFNVKTIESEPEPCSDEENGDNRLRKYFDTKESLHICWNAKKHVGFLRPQLRSPKVGGQRFMFQFDDDSVEKHVALKCPSVPVMYVHFGVSETDIRVIVFKKNYRARNRKNATPSHYYIPPLEK